MNESKKREEDVRKKKQKQEDLRNSEGISER